MRCAGVAFGCIGAGLEIGPFCIGKRHYGDELYQEAENIVGLDHSILRELKSISDVYEMLQRHNNLSWSHHLDVVEKSLLALRDVIDIYTDEVRRQTEFRTLAEENKDKEAACKAN